MTTSGQRRKDANRIAALIASMPEPERAVFLLHRVKATPLDQIALDLDISVAEVERRFSDAMLHLDDPSPDDRRT